MEYLLGFVLLLGVLIFIHELGHFLAAKAVNVRVEAFSIGMGKKILQFTRGETTYAISLLPLGGYVKVTGQDPREEVPPELEARSYRAKAIWQRALIVIAGPLFNAALAVMVFVGLVIVGLPSLSPTLSRVLPGSPAFEAGFRSGDVVNMVTLADGKLLRVRERSDLEEILAKNVGQPLTFTVSRPSPFPDPAPIEPGTAEKAVDLPLTPRSGTAETLNLNYSPVIGQDRDTTLGIVEERGVLAGVEYGAFAPIVSSRAQGWAASRAIPSPFVVAELQYRNEMGATKALRIANYDELVVAWRRALEASPADKGQITLRGFRLEPAPAKGETPKVPEIQQHNLAWSSAAERPSPTLTEAGLLPAELMVLDVVAGTPAEKMGLKSGDVILELAGRPVASFQSFRADIQRLAASGEALRIAYLRDGETLSAELRPESVDMTDPLTETKKKQFQIGATFLANSAEAPMTLLRADGFGEAVVLGWNKTVSLTASMLKSFYHLATGGISPKTLGGPLLIAKISGESFKQGAIPFLRMMAFISLNLFILNLLPVPVLDGGHLVLLGIEAVRRKPLNIKIIEAWTTAGFFLLMGLVAIVFFNDLSRMGLFKFLNL